MTFMELAPASKPKEGPIAKVDAEVEAKKVLVLRRITIHMYRV
jgi:hypothetical protein